MKNFEEVKKYMDENNKRPVLSSNDEKISFLCSWLTRQMTFFRRKYRIMKDEKFYNIWNNFINGEKYKQHFETNENKWLQRYDELKQYIDKNNSLPTKLTNKKLNKWLDHQKENFIKTQDLMKNQNIKFLWNNLINDEKYKLLFEPINNVEIWKQKFELLKKYIDDNDKRPNSNDKDKNIKILGKWCCRQVENAEKRFQILSNEEVFTIWTEFVSNDKYKKFFMNHETFFKNKLNEVIEFMELNKRKPKITIHNEDECALGDWYSSQQENYNKKQKLMKCEEIRKLWEDMTTKYIDYIGKII